MAAGGVRPLANEMSDYMAVADDRIDELEPVMTTVGGKVMYELRK
jgi:predicted amidohydrolase YtcJ